MKSSSSSKFKLLAAAVAAVGATVALPKAGHAQATVTYILSINDDGAGNTGAAAETTAQNDTGAASGVSQYAIYAVESGTGTFGFAGLGINVGGVDTTTDFLENDLITGSATPGSTNTKKGALALEEGFTVKDSPTYPIGGSQDTSTLAGQLSPPAVFLAYGAGQSANTGNAIAQGLGGSKSTFTPSGTAGVGATSYGVPLTITNDASGNAISGGPSFPAAILVADGSYQIGTETPAFILNNNSANLFVEDGQANFSAGGGNTENIGESGITFITQTIPIGGVTPPPPTVVAAELDAAASNGGANDGTVAIGPGNGNYVPVKISLTTPNNKGFISYSGFTAGDNVDVALKFASGGSAISSTEIAALVAYINANDNGEGNIASAYSSAPSQVQTALGAGAYDVLLTDVAGAGDPFANYDFSQFTDSSLVVTGIGVVPEPASLSLLALGGVGLVSRRRRK